jgi:Mg2+/Co2+ transporter CorC
MIELFGRIPNSGEEMRLEAFQFKIQSVDARRVKKIVVTQIPTEKSDESHES